MREFELVIFDCDGVLIDSQMISARMRAVNKGSEPENTTELSDEADRAAWLNCVALMTQDQIAKEFGVLRWRAQRSAARILEQGPGHVRPKYRIPNGL